ncbi:hypothetical protein ASPCADRAFT_203967 [Aspergillus carbonarius ITEM 5010]|uniref:Uncharacterized protein n=1 Tax=Aspergillus carbonarius (strain ITEM 5010) TaxID=602072 RepID=A0A1R3S019_ASPC5|nr:hypothetical protein ASPCADRAFT_203967 [Aspergillus carbonarius ITEM 5010]
MPRYDPCYPLTLELLLRFLAHSSSLADPQRLYLEAPGTFRSYYSLQLTDSTFVIIQGVVMRLLREVINDEMFMN